MEQLPLPPLIFYCSIRKPIQGALYPIQLTESSVKGRRLCNTYTQRMEFFCQGRKKGEYKGGESDNITEESPHLQVDLQQKIYPIIRQECLDKKLLKKLGMTQHVIIQRNPPPTRFCCRCVTQPYQESGKTNSFHNIVRQRNGQIYMPNILVLVPHMDMVLNL